MPERRAPKKKTTRRRTRAKRSVSTKVEQDSRVIEDKTTEHEDGALDCEHAAQVSVGNKVTRNMGDYNSLTVSVHVSIPCVPTDDEIRRTYERGSMLVDSLMEDEFTKASAQF